LARVVQRVVQAHPVQRGLIQFFQLLHQPVADLALVELLQQLMAEQVVQAVHLLTPVQAGQLLLPAKVMLEQHQAHLMDHQAAAVEHQQPVLE
jgi:hypothetical protein